MAKILEIRNSTAEFLTFLVENKEEGVQVVYCDETIWATQVAMGELFGVSSKTINEHLTNIFNEGELQKDATVRNFQIVQLEGARNVNREPMFYNLDAIISVGYRVSLQDAGRITSEFAKEYAETEFEKYRVIQDRLFSSDFDKLTSSQLPELPFVEE